MTEPVAVVEELDNPFARDRFLLKQKRLSINEKYFISGDRGDRILFVERPSHLLQQLLAVGACLAAITVVVVIGVVLSELAKRISEDLAVVVGVGGLFVGIIGGLILAMLLYPKRKFTLFDQYVLDMTPDPERELDRRVAVAIGVLLDTGERR